MRTVVRLTLLGCVLAGLGLAAGAVTGAQDVGKDQVKLEVGDTAPLFAGLDDQGLPWQSKDHVGKKYIVVYFYPGDFTPGCTRQAQNFRDNMNSLSLQGAMVVGVSGDSTATHGLFKKEHQVNFPLLADETGSLAKRFGVPVGPGGKVRAKGEDSKFMTLERPVTTARWTFIIDKDGKVVYKNTRVDPVKDSQTVHAFIEAMEMR